MTIRNFDLASDYRPWSGAVETWEKIVDADKVDDLEQLIKECYPDGMDSVTAINDILWFDEEWVLSNLGLAEDEEEEEE